MDERGMGPMTEVRELEMSATRRVRLSEPLLKASDVAELFCLPVSTIYELARSSRIPCLRIGRAVRFYRSQLEHHLSEQL
jgi:excisionase family DNA binding protein